MGHSEGSPEREDPSNTGPHKKDRKISNKQPNPTSTELEEWLQTKPKMSRKKEVKIRVK